MQTLSLNRFYILSFSLLILLSFILNLEGSTINKIFFGMGYVWCMALRTPNANEKVSRKRYRFSFYKTIWSIDTFFTELISSNKHPYAKMFLRQLPLILIFGGCCYLFEVDGSLLFLFLGGFIFEVFMEALSILTCRR